MGMGTGSPARFLVQVLPVHSIPPTQVSHSLPHKLFGDLLATTILSLLVTQMTPTMQWKYFCAQD
jgi:hypothetical protein